MRNFVDVRSFLLRKDGEVFLRKHLTHILNTSNSKNMPKKNKEFFGGISLKIFETMYTKFYIVQAIQKSPTISRTSPTTRCIMKFKNLYYVV